VLVAVGDLAVLAESCVVVEPGCADLGEARGRPERVGDLPGAAGVDGFAVAVVSGGALKQEVPLSWLASLWRGVRGTGTHEAIRQLADLRRKLGHE
jgi:hypothetical protein